MAKRSGVLELAVLGLLHESPMHGYELRKRLASQLGTFRALSYGSLYPCLEALVRQGLIAESGRPDAEPGSRRSKIVYQLTADGKEHFQDLLAESGPARGTTRASASASPSSAAPTPTSACAS